jgi:hypothetical protein
MQFRSNKRKFIKDFPKNQTKFPHNEDMAKYSQLCREFARCTCRLWMVCWTGAQRCLCDSWEMR